MMQPMTRSNVSMFPKKAFACIGGTLVVMGAVSIVLGSVTLGLSISKVKRCDVYTHFMDVRDFMRKDFTLPDVPTSRCQKNLIVAIFAPAGIWNGVMFIVAGSLGIAASRTSRGHKQSGLKTGFMVMSILNALFFATNYMIASAAVPAILETMFEEVPKVHAVLGLVQGIMAFAVMMLSIIGASTACCCSPPDDEVKFVVSGYSPTPPLACIDPNDDKFKLLLPDEKQGKI